MVRRALLSALALVAAVMLNGCAARLSEPATGQHFRPLTGAAATVAVGDQRFALVVFAPPVPMLLVRTGPMFFWVTPSAALRQVFLEDEIKGVPVDTHVLQVNATGTMDCTYTLRWGS
jgi:hypothetical protein